MCTSGLREPSSVQTHHVPNTSPLKHTTSVGLGLQVYKTAFQSFQTTSIIILDHQILYPVLHRSAGTAPKQTRINYVVHSHGSNINYYPIYLPQHQLLYWGRRQPNGEGIRCLQRSPCRGVASLTSIQPRLQDLALEWQTVTRHCLQEFPCDP